MQSREAAEDALKSAQTQQKDGDAKAVSLEKVRSRAEREGLRAVMSLRLLLEAGAMGS